ncbi:YbaB/EbfC family nucleoid-associated protein [Nonomuraea sp. B10E15]|uniref:YbaB/EbfC family nucleoid-associated protein n=1 Tax=Nonomuraea sp. B10E15 TaxID=3153560 RepID=UPI00325D4995
MTPVTDFGDFGNIDIDKLLHSLEDQVSKSEQVQKSMGRLVGRGEDDDGLVVVEYAHDGLRTLDIRPKAMRLSSGELSERIKAVLQDAIEDLQRQIDEFMTETYGKEANPMRMIDNPAALLKDVRRAEGSYERAFEDVMGELTRIRRELDL